MDLRAGGKWSTRGISQTTGEFVVHGEYLEVDPPKFLAYTWNAPWMSGVTTKVFFELAEQDTGTLIKAMHSGFAGNMKQAVDHSDGWTRMLGWLQAFVERSETIDSRG